MTYQQRVAIWFEKCFGLTEYRSRKERAYRFLEEALELVQSLGVTEDECVRLLDYVYQRPVGDPAQEIGGVMVTLHALAHVEVLDVDYAAETELTRVNTPEIIAKIRGKQVSKNLRMIGQA